MTKEKLTTRHAQLLNRPPTTDQLELYAEAPVKRGFTSPHGLTDEQEARLFEAVFVLALNQTFVRVGEKMPNVYLFVPPNMESWAAQQLRTIAVKMFDICKAQTRENRGAGIAKAKLIGEAYRHVLLGSRVSAATTPPDHWAAFGFASGPDVPEWVMSALIPLSPFLRDD